MRLQVQSIVRGARGQLQQPVRQSLAVEDHAGTVCPLPKTEDRRELLAGISVQLCELAGAGIGRGRLGRVIPFGRNQRQAAGQLQLDLARVPRRSLAQWRQCR